MPPEQQLQRAQLPELAQEYNCSPPLRGLMEGLDPSLMDSLYPPLFCPDLENFRVVGGKWETRAGQVAEKVIPGSGNPRLLDNLYQSTALPVTAVNLIAANFDWLENATNSGALFAGQDLTVCAWVYANTLGGAERTICCEFDVTTTSRFAYTLNYDPGGKFGFKVSRSDLSGTLTGILSTLAPVINTWYFVVGRHDAVNHVLSISINGAAPQSVGYAGGVAEPPTPFRVGALFNSSSTGSSFWDGRAQTLSVYRSAPGAGGALTDATVTALYNNGVPLAYGALSAAQKVGLAGAWGLGETGGTRADALGVFPLTPHPSSVEPGTAVGLSSGLGQTTRLAARGTGSAATLYEFKVESDANYQAVSGGTNLGGTAQPYFQGVTIGDAYLMTDRQGALRRYTRGSGVAGALAAVTNGTAPTLAPVVTSRWYDRLESWTTPANWTASGAHFTLTDATAANPPPGGGHSVNALVVDTGGAGATLTPTATGTALPSHQIAFWLYQRIDTKTFTQLGLGINGADEFSVPLITAQVNTWYPQFFQVGDIGTLNFLRLKVLDASRAPNGEILSALYLPGRLDGSYRWLYTYYTPATGLETAPSPISNGGVATDMSLIGVTNDVNSGRAFQKSAALRFTASGSPQKIRIYRSGGVPELTKDARGFDVWYRVGEVFDFTTTLNGGISAAFTSLVVTAAGNIAIGDQLVIEPGVAGKEEYVRVTNVAGTTLTVRGMDQDNKGQFAHSNGVTVQIAFVDNVANETIDVTQPVDVRRDDPPAGALFVQRNPDGRLWIFGFKDNPTGVAVSNRATPDRPLDYLTFPDNVDPLTRRSLTQGWRFKVGGDNTDETIVWGGFFQGLPHILTKRHLYVVEALSQVDWGPIAVQKVLNVGCISGDTVQEVNETLMWVADGPRVVRYRGRATPPEITSYLRVNVRLEAAPPANWLQWFARAHTTDQGHYYVLYFVPAGQTTCTQRLDYLADRDSIGSTEIGDLWEPVVYYDSLANPVAMYAAVVRDGGSDDRNLYHVDGTGQIYETEQGLTDNGAPIRCRCTTKRYPLAIFSRYPSGALGDVAPGSTRHLLIGQVSMLTQLFIRNEGVTDTLQIQVQAGGSDYGVVSHNYTVDLAATGDTEAKVRLHRDLYGRWGQLTFSGSFVNRASIREVTLWALPIRSGSLRT